MFNVSFPGLGIDLTINRVAFSIGNFSVYWYGILIALGMLLAVLYAYFNAKYFGVDRDKLFDCIIVRDSIIRNNYRSYLFGCSDNY